MMDGVNWYGYANNNPIKYVDPNGLESYHEEYIRTEQDKNRTYQKAEEQIKTFKKADETRKNIEKNKIGNLLKAHNQKFTFKVYRKKESHLSGKLDREGGKRGKGEWGIKKHYNLDTIIIKNIENDETVTFEETQSVVNHKIYPYENTIKEGLFYFRIAPWLSESWSPGTHLRLSGAMTLGGYEIDESWCGHSNTSGTGAWWGEILYSGGCIMNERMGEIIQTLNNFGAKTGDIYVGEIIEYTDFEY